MPLSCLLCSKCKLNILDNTHHFNVFDSKYGALSSIDHYTETKLYCTATETNGVYLVSIHTGGSDKVAKVSISGLFLKFNVTHCWRG